MCEVWGILVVTFLQKYKRLGTASQTVYIWKEVVTLTTVLTNKYFSLLEFQVTLLRRVIPGKVKDALLADKSAK